MSLHLGIGASQLNQLAVNQNAPILASLEHLAGVLASGDFVILAVVGVHDLTALIAKVSESLCGSSIRGSSVNLGHIEQNILLTSDSHSIISNSGSGGLDVDNAISISQILQVASAIGIAGSSGDGDGLVGLLGHSAIRSDDLTTDVGAIGQIQVIVVRRERGGAQCQSHDHGQHSCNDLLHVCFLHKNLFVSGSASSSETAFTT